MSADTVRELSGLFVCPVCRQGIVLDPQGWYCKRCDRFWPVENGIPDFLQEPAPYWGELSAEEMNQLNLEARQKGWKQALSQRLPAQLYSFICDEKRVSWRYLVPSDTKGRVLDMGAGWGTLSFSLAARGAQVFALEQVAQRLDFIALRREEEHRNNVVPLRASALRLPFADASFDVVILNGVLEWIGLSDQSRPADQVQKDCLRQVNRVLKPGGSLYIGIENRLAFFYFMGVKDPHSGLRFTTIMPRAMARMHSLLVKKRDYRTYLYSLAGYRSLLKQAGFSSVSFYLPVPGYLNLRYLVPLEPESGLRFFIENTVSTRIIFSSPLVKFLYRLLRVLARFWLLGPARYFVPDYSIIAVK